VSVASVEIRYKNNNVDEPALHVGLALP